MADFIFWIWPITIAVFVLSVATGGIAHRLNLKWLDQFSLMLTLAGVVCAIIGVISGYMGG